MQVRLIPEGVNPEYPYAICNSDGFVMARFRTEEAANTWSALRRFNVVEDAEFPHYGD